jgi:hypothetical protein
MMTLPVRGLRPLRAARRVTTNVPKPEMVTRRPRRSESTMLARKVFMARSAAVLDPPAAFAMTATSSAFVIHLFYYARAGHCQSATTSHPAAVSPRASHGRRGDPGDACDIMSGAVEIGPM